MDDDTVAAESIEFVFSFFWGGGGGWESYSIASVKTTRCKKTTRAKSSLCADRATSKLLMTCCFLHKCHYRLPYICRGQVGDREKLSSSQHLPAHSSIIFKFILL